MGRDGMQELGGTVCDGVLPGSRGEIDQRPEVGGAGELQCLLGRPPTSLTPHHQHGVGVRRPTVEAEQVAEVGEGVAGVGGITAHGQRHSGRMADRP